MKNCIQVLCKKFKFIARFSFVWLAAIALGLLLSSNLTQAQNANSQLAKEVYIVSCSGCHLPIPAEVLPTKTWEQILNNPANHYGTSISLPNRVITRLIWSYLKNNSRPLIAGETTPEYVTNSRYLKALHPQVDLPKPTTHQSCNLCHPNAERLDYITVNN
ncbi:cytochrome C [Myxosarcina sp. GI1(2024)]